MKFDYTNWTTRIFDGFYESNLYNSDTEYYLNENYRDEEHPEVLELDFKPYCNEVSEFAASLLKDYCIHSDNIISDIKFTGISSPRYYNYETDRLNLDIKLNLTKLKRFIKENQPDFNLYLKDNFTSYSGFTSFVDNNYREFMETYSTGDSIDKHRCISTMLEYYILTKGIYQTSWRNIKEIDCYSDTPYHQELYEMAMEAQMNHTKIAA